MKYLVFLIPCASLIYSSVTKLLWPERIVRRDLREISEQGLRKHILRSSWLTLVMGICLIISYGFIEIALRMLWVIMGASLVLTPLFFFLNKSADSDVEPILASITERAVNKLVQKKRWQALGSLAMLAAWIYSWRFILGEFR
jgi:hypothetical protein